MAKAWLKEQMRAQELREELLERATELHGLIQRTRDSDPVKVAMLPGFKRGIHEVPCEFVALVWLMFQYERMPS